MRRHAVTEAIKEMMHRHFPDAVTMLYGSEARGDAQSDSDIDILILMPDSLDKAEFNRRKFALFDKIYDIELDMSTNISTLILRYKDWKARKTPFTINVNNEAILL